MQPFVWTDDLEHQPLLKELKGFTMTSEMMESGFETYVFDLFSTGNVTP